MGLSCGRWGVCTSIHLARTHPRAVLKSCGGGHSASVQQGLQLFAIADSCLHSWALSLVLVASFPRASALPSPDSAASLSRQPASTSLLSSRAGGWGGVGWGTPWDPEVGAFASLCPLTLYPSPGAATPSTVPSFVCYLRAPLGPLGFL